MSCPGPYFRADRPGQIIHHYHKIQVAGYVYKEKRFASLSFGGYDTIVSRVGFGKDLMAFLWEHMQDQEVTW
jgi:hypothetical protein